MRWQLALGLGSDLLHGVAHLYKHGTIHRDLKPANVLVCGRVHMRQDTIASLGRTTNSTRLMRSGGAPRAEPSPHLNRPRLRLADFGMAQVGRHAYDEQVSSHGNDGEGSFALSGTSGSGAALAASATSSFQSRSSSSSSVATPASSVLTSTTTTQQQYPELYLDPHRFGEMLVQTPAYRAPEVNNDCARRLPYEIIGTGINNCPTGAAACKSKTGYSQSRSGAAAAGASVRSGGTAAAASSTAQSSRSSSMIDDQIQNTIAWTHKIDVWSVGLIMLDILKALFPPERELIPSPVFGPTENGKSLRGTDLYSERVYHELRLPLDLKAKAYQVDRAGAPLPGQYSFKVGAAQQQMQRQQELQVHDPASTASDVVMGTSSVSTTTAAHQQQQQQERSQQLNSLHFPEFTVVSQMGNSHASTNAGQNPRVARGPLVPPSHRRTQPISSLQGFSSQVEEQRKADAERKKRAIEQHEFATQLDNAAAEMMAGLHGYKQLYFKDVVQRVQTSLQNLPGLRTPEHVQLQAELKRMAVALRKMLNPIPEERGHVLEVLQDWMEIGATKKTSSSISSSSTSVVSGQEAHVEGASTISPHSRQAAATTTGSSSNSVVDQYRPDPSFRPTFPRMFQYLQDDMKEFLPPLSTFVILQLYADQVRESIRVTDEKNAALNSQRGNSRALERESGIRDWRLIMIDKPPWYPGCRAGEDEDDVTARSAADHPHVGTGPVGKNDAVVANKKSFSSSDSSGEFSTSRLRVVDGSVTGSSASSTSAILRGRDYRRREQEPSSRGEDDDRSAMMSVSAASAAVEDDTELCPEELQQPRGWGRTGGSSTTTAAAAPDGEATTATAESGHHADRAGAASSRIAATNTRAFRGWGPVAPAVPPASQPRPATVEQERQHGGPVVLGSTCCPPAASTAADTATTCTTAAAPARNLRLPFQDPPERQCFLRNCGAAIWNLIFPNRTGGNVGTRTTPGGSSRGGAGGAPAGARQQGTNLVPSQHAVTGTNNATTNFIPQVFGHPVPPPRDRTPPLQQPAFITRL